MTDDADTNMLQRWRKRVHAFLVGRQASVPALPDSARETSSRTKHGVSDSRSPQAPNGSVLPEDYLAIKSEHAILREESERYRAIFDTYHAEMQRLSEPMLAHLKNPLPHVKPGPGGSLQDTVRKAFLVPGWQPFDVGKVRLPLPDRGAPAENFHAYFRDRLPDFSDSQREHLLTRLLDLNAGAYKKAAALLELAPTPDVNAYQFDWWTGHAPNIVAAEQQKFIMLIDEALTMADAGLAALFLSFNFRLFVVSSVNARVNDPRFYEQSTPSPFVYMMV